MNSTLIVLFILAASLLLGCKPSPMETSDGRLIYSNCFESSQDTIGWKGYGSLQLVPDAPVGGGSHSARVSGACPVPHACTTLTIPAGVGAVTLQCWGKNLANGGTVRVYRTGNLSPSIMVGISDSVWTLYKSATSLPCATGDTLELAMNSGGIVYSAMLIDCIEIHSVQ